MYEGIETVSGLLGVGSGIMFTAIALMVAMGVTLFTYTATRSMVATLLSSVLALGACVLMGLVPIWMVVVQAVIVGGYIFMQGNFGFGTEKETKAEAKPQVVDDLLTQSQKWAEYHNNLDKLLGLQTRMSDTDWYPLQLYQTKDFLNEETLEKKEFKADTLEISKKYDWYIADKHPRKLEFRVVGVDKSDNDVRVTYLLGNANGKPYLKKVDDAEKVCKEYEVVMV